MDGWWEIQYERLLDISRLWLVVRVVDLLWSDGEVRHLGLIVDDVGSAKLWLETRELHAR